MCFLQELVSVAVQNVQEMENIVNDPNKNDTNSLLHNNGNDPYKHFVITAFVLLHNKNVCFKYEFNSGHNLLYFCPAFPFLFPCLII